MLIRYLKDGLEEISGDVLVVAEGTNSFFIEGDRPSSLKMIPFDMVVSKIYGQDEKLPYILDFIEEKGITDVDFSLTEITVH
jgi:hypothetical protein